MIGTGTGALPVMEEVKREAQRRKIKLIILPTLEAIQEAEARIRCNQRDPARHLLNR